jgi:hypothetical protein
LAATLPCVLAAKGVAPGPYECWFHNTPQPLKNFTLKDGTYIGHRFRQRTEVQQRQSRWPDRHLQWRESADHQLLQRRRRRGASVPARFVQQGRAKTIKAKPYFEEARLRLERIGSLEA